MEGTSGVRRNRAYMDQIKAQVNQPDDGWVWGNHRGGGGAPVRDTDGNNVSNLKGIVPNHDQRMSGKGRRDWSPELLPKPKGGRRFREQVQEEEDAFEDIALPARRGGARQPPPLLQPRAVPKIGNRGAHQNDDEEELFIPGLNNVRMNTSTSSNHNNNQMNSISPGNSPKKFMSAIQEMNSSVTNHEKQAKNKRELEYQAALRKQIEDKQRQKEEEKRKDDEMKRREYEEYMRHTNPGFVMPKQQQQQQQPPLFKESRQNNNNTANNYHNNNSSKGNKRVPGLDFEEEDDEEQEQQYGNRRGGGRKGAPPVINNRQQQPSRSVYNQNDDDDDEEGYSPHRRQRPQQQELIPAEKYDELTALCEKLMRQQEELQAEIHQQATVIKELQKAKGGNGAPMMRSKSVQQPRPAPASEGRSSSVERRRITAANDNNGNKQRPSSMHAAPVGRIPNELPFKKHNLSAAEQKKQAKVAFGGSAVNGEKKLSAAGSNVTNSKQGPKANKSTGDLLAHKRNGNEGVSNGFAKLQLKTTGGPRVVTYEDDEAIDILPARRGGNGNTMQGSMNLELRGQSKYISVGNDDEVSGDQLDQLLAGTRRNNRHGGY